MTLATYLRIAWRNLRQGGRRTLLLGAAIAVVTFILVALSALAVGLEQTMIRSASTLLSGHVNVGGFYKVTRGQAAPLINGVTELRRIVEDELDGVDLIIDRQRGWAKIVGENTSFHTALAGIDITEERRLVDVLQVMPTKPPGDLTALAEAGTVVIFQKQAERLEASVGDMLTLTSLTTGGINNTADVRIVAVVRDVGFMSAWSVFVAKETVRALYQLKPDTTGAIQIYLDDPDRAPEVMAQLRERLNTTHQLLDHDPQAFFMKFERVSGEDWTGQRLDLTTWRDEISYMLWILAGFATIRWLLLSMLLILIVIGIMNAMWMTIRERTREVGTLRAIGMAPRQVLWMFLLEGVLLGLAASGIGALIGGAGAWAVDAMRISIGSEAFQMVLMSDRLNMTVTLTDLLGAITVVTLVTTLAALYPAWRAARLKPVTALRHFG